MRQVPGTRLGRALPHHLVELPAVVPTAARQASEVGVESNDRRASLPMICGTVWVERGETVVLLGFHRQCRLVVHDWPPLSLIGSEQYHCPTGRGVTPAPHSQAGAERSETVGLSGLKARTLVLDKKEAPRRALVMKQVAGQVGVNRPADSINARHAQRFPEPLSAGAHRCRARLG